MHGCSTPAHSGVKCTSEPQGAFSLQPTALWRSKSGSSLISRSRSDRLTCCLDLELSRPAAFTVTLCTVALAVIWMGLPLLWARNLISVYFTAQYLRSAACPALAASELIRRARLNAARNRAGTGSECRRNVCSLQISWCLISELMWGQ